MKAANKQPVQRRLIYMECNNRLCRMIPKVKSKYLCFNSVRTTQNSNG